jgi:serine/threonine protein kinase
MPPPADPIVAICQQEKLDRPKFAGTGAFKDTYEAVNPAGETFALKVYKSSTRTARNDREIDAMSRCSHPSVAKLIGMGSVQHGGIDIHYLIEEFLPGGTLAERLRSKGLMDVDATKILARPLCGALEHLYGLGLVHRDIKPENIMYRADGTPVLVDFGLVRDLGAVSLTPNWLLAGPGTPYYASPEQLRNDKAQIDWRTDQFGLGVVLSIAFLGRHPYAEPNDQMGDTVDRVAGHGKVNQQSSDQLAAASLSCLIKMAAPYPVHRFRLPNDLISAWGA